MVPNPIASSELQAYWYAGLQQAGIAFGAVGDVGYAAELIGKAAELRNRFNEAFWMPELGAYALGLDPEKRQIRSIGSNDGHLLASGIVPPERGRRLAARLMQPDMFSGWGIRTLSAEHPAFNPFSYHRGSVWPVEQGTIAFGFARYGCWDELHRLADGVFRATDLFIENRLPEVISGIQRDPEHPHPGIYPDSCEPQGWSASAVIMVVQSLLAMVAGTDGSAGGRSAPARLAARPPARACALARPASTFSSSGRDRAGRGTASCGAKGGFASFGSRLRRRLGQASPDGPGAPGLGATVLGLEAVLRGRRVVVHVRRAGVLLHLLLGIVFLMRMQHRRVVVPVAVVLRPMLELTQQPAGVMVRDVVVVVIVKLGIVAVLMPASPGTRCVV